MPTKNDKDIKREIKNKGVYVLIRRTYHDVELINAYTTKKDADKEKYRLDEKFKGKKRVFDYYEVRKTPLIFNSRTKK